MSDSLAYERCEIKSSQKYREWLVGRPVEWRFVYHVEQCLPRRIVASEFRVFLLLVLDFIPKETLVTRRETGRCTHHSKPTQIPVSSATRKAYHLLYFVNNSEISGAPVNKALRAV